MILFSPPHFCEPAMLEERVCNHRHQRMTMKAVPDLPECYQNVLHNGNLARAGPRGSLRADGRKSRTLLGKPPPCMSGYNRLRNEIFR